MLSDEEKEALRNFKSEYETCDHYSSDLIIGLDDAEIILNLFEKQFKEIEELKQEKEYLNCIIESDKDNYINKDKIKAKIESVDYSSHCKAERIAMKEVLQSLLEED